MNFNEINTTELDKYLSPVERAEWNSIYASYRAGSVLSGEISGIDGYSLGGKGKRVIAAIVIPFRVKILIPKNMLWENSENIPESAVKKMLGAKIDFVIQDIDRENCCCVASRIEAMKIKRKRFFNGFPKVGDLVDCKVIAVRKNMLNVESCGFDMIFTKRDLCYSIRHDLRPYYENGQILQAVIKETGEKNEDGSFQAPGVSVREAKPHPYIGIRQRHPRNSRRSSVITGKYKGSIFCKLEEDYECLCNYSKLQKDSDFEVGDKVVIAVKEYDDREKRVYGVIISKRN